VDLAVLHFIDHWHVLRGSAVAQVRQQTATRTILTGLFEGVKRICIAITEPDAGSDVAGIQTTAEKSADGKFFIVNGTKKWSVASQAISQISQLKIVGSRMASGRPMPQWLYEQAALARRACRFSLFLFSIPLE